MKTNLTLKNLVLLGYFLLTSIFTFAQLPTNCADMAPICTDAGLSFTAEASGVNAPGGNNYDCLGTQPDPTWYYLQISDAGDLNMTLSAADDVDFALYGPYTSIPDAQSYCGNMGTGTSTNFVVDCSFDPSEIESVNISGAAVGEVYVLLITNYSGDVQTVNLTLDGSSTGATDCSIVTPCNIDNFNVTIGACDPTTNTFDITGTVDITSPPSTGDLIAEDCNGNQTVVASAPFGASSYNFSINNITSDGAACSIQVYFTDDAGCSQTLNYTNPAPCTPSCFITNFEVNNTAQCNQVWESDVTIEFTAPPTTGDLVVEDCQGNITVIQSAPFSSPATGTFSTTVGSATPFNCDYTAYFTSDPACSSTVTFTPLPATPPGDEAGTFSESMAGNGTHTYILCDGDSFTMTSNGDANIPPIAPGNDPSVIYFVYSCPPSPGGPGIDPTADPCFVGYIGANGFTVTNNGGSSDSFITSLGGGLTDNTYYIVPMTLGSLSGLTYQADCYDLSIGDQQTIQYLNPITYTQTSDCQAGTVTVSNLQGGYPEFYGGNYTASNLTPASASFNNTTANLGGSIVISGLQDGDNYSFNITDGNGCPITITGTFVGTEDPSFNYPNNAYCTTDADPSPTITGVSGGTFSVSPAGLTVNPTTGTIDLSSVPAGGTFTITYTTPDPVCFDTAQFIVTVNPQPTVNAGPDQSVCPGNQVTLTASGNAATYTWDNGVTDGSPFTPPVGSTTYTLTGTSAAGCENTDQVVVSTFTPPTVNAGPNQSVCTGTSVTLSGSGATTYTWDNGVTDATPFTPTVGTVTYTVTGTDANGCTDTDQVDVTVNPQPTINAGADFSTCIGSTITLSGSGAGAGGTYTWDNGVTDGVAFTINSTTTFTVTGTDANGCTNTDQITVTVLPNAPIDAGPDQAICNGENATITASGGTIYSWDNGLGSGASHNVNPTTTTTYTVTGTDAMGCVGTDAVTITVNPLPTINAGVDQAVCDGTSVTLSGSGAGAGGTYTWDNGVTNGVAFTPTVGTTTYTVTGTDANGCENTDQVAVTVNPLPTVNAGTDQTVCDGTTVTLTGSGTATIYTWDNGISNGVAFTPTVGTTTYTVTGTDANGCENTDQVAVTVNPLPTVNAGPDQAVCDGTTVTLTGSGAGAGGTYTWDNGITDGTAFTPTATQTYTVTGTDANGCENTDQVVVTVNPLPNVNAGTDQAICDGESVTLSGSGAGVGGTYTWNNGVSDGTAFSPTSTQTYTVTGTDANGCENTDQVVVTVNPLPNVNAGTDQTVCDGTTVTLTGSGSATTYTWDNGISNGVAFTPTVGTTTYTVTGTDANGCESTDQVDVNVNALPTVNAGVDQAVCDGSSVTLSGSGAGVGGTYTWDNGVTDGVAFTQGLGSTTYTVTGTDGNGCENTDQVIVTVNPNPNPSINGATEYCAGFSAGLDAGAGYSTYNWSTGATSQTINATDADNPISVTVTNAFGCSGTSPTFTVTENSVITTNFTYEICQGESMVIHGVTETTSGTYSQTYPSATGCDSTSNVTLIVNPLPNVNAGTDDALCVGASTSLTATGATNYTWDNGITQGTTFTPATTNTYTVTGTDANGCENTDQVVVTVNPLPNVNAGPDIAICIGQQTATLNGSGAQTYTWNNGVTDGIAFSPSATNTYTVTGTDANGCENTDQVIVTVNPLPNVNAGIDQEVCDGVQTTLSGSGAQNYTWDNGITDGVAFTQAVGTTTYIVTGTDANGCTNTDQVDVIVNPLPNVLAGSDQTVCDGTNVTLSGSGAATYTWDNGVSNGVAFTQAVGTTTYTVTGTDANGCENTNQVVVTVNPLPNVNAGTDIAICIGQQTATLNGSGAQTYTWNNGVTDGVSFSPSATNTYTVTGTDANGCENTDQVLVTVNPLPNVDAGIDQEVCDGVQTTLSGAGAQNYTWDNGITNGVAFTQAVGTTTYTVTGTDANGCTNTDQVDVIVDALPVVDAGSNQTVCDGTSVTLSGSGAGAGATYTWDNGIQNNVSFTQAVGTTTYTVTGTDANGCIATDQTDVTVNAIPVVNAGPYQEVCDGTSVTLTATGATTYTWDHSVTNGVSFTPVVGSLTYTVTGTTLGCISSDEVIVTVNALPNVFAGNDVIVCQDGTVILTASGAQTFAWTNGVSNGVEFTAPDDTTTYSVTGTDANGCINTDNMQVNVIPTPTVSFEGRDLIGCSPLEVTLVNNSTGNLTNCHWSFSNGQNAIGCDSILATFTDEGCYDITLTVSTPQGCANTMTIPDYVCVVPDPIADFYTDPVELSTVNWTANMVNTSVNATSFEWSFGDGSSTSTEFEPSHDYPNNQSGTYRIKLTATTDYGCTDTTTRVIHLKEDLIFYVPNTFTPDNDNFNETFKPIFSSGYDPYSYTLLIFNRWGEILFESHNTEVGWDGTYGGKTVEDGVYIWKITIKRRDSDEKVQRIGHINVLR